MSEALRRAVVAFLALDERHRPALHPDAIMAVAAIRAALSEGQAPEPVAPFDALHAANESRLREMEARGQVVRKAPAQQAPEPVAQEPKCGISWNGFNLSGDSASIDEAKRGIHALGIVPQLKEEIRRLRAGMDAARAKAIEEAETWKARAMFLLGHSDNGMSNCYSLNEVDAAIRALATKGAGS